MEEIDAKAFVNHKHNGVYLKFPNGNAISTIWGQGSYSENHDFSTGDVLSDYSTLIKEGSNTVEIMIYTDSTKLAKRIFRKCAPGSKDTVIGWVDMPTWLWVIKQLSGVSQ